MDISFRLLTELYSFLQVKNEKIIKCIKSCVSVSLRSIIHSYKLAEIFSKELDAAYEFPSPYGVIFILTKDNHRVIAKQLRVSVSLRSYIHSYFGMGCCL